MQVSTDPNQYLLRSTWKCKSMLTQNGFVFFFVSLFVYFKEWFNKLFEKLIACITV